MGKKIETKENCGVTIEDSNSENWKQTLDVNLFGTYYCAHSAIAFLKQRGAGKIIFMLAL